MTTPNATRDDDSAEISDRTFAAFMVVDEHRRLSEAVMAMVDMIGDVQNGRVSVKVENLRKVTARMVYKSRRDLTDGLLFAIEIDDSPLDEKVVDAIAKSSDEAAELRDQLDAEIKADEGEDR